MVEVAANFVSFLKTLGNPGQSQALCWKNHFGFFKSCCNASKIFPAIRSLDIRFRKDYTATPFMFDATLYDLELQKTSLKSNFLEARAAHPAHSAKTSQELSCIKQIMCPFNNALSVTPLLLCASSVLGGDICSTAAIFPPLTTDPQSYPELMARALSLSKGSHNSAKAGTSEALLPLPALITLKTSGSTYACSAEKSHTTPSRGLANVTPPSQHRAEKPFVNTLPSIFSQIFNSQ